ncbi:hypothetical protein [Rhodococcus sp. 1168]|uniref:hypothetical protein n=1 Tax=Rhodococcus sp. 1168 TaxID=2018041 RepID=UPI000A0E8CCC|nr:hypothetical protein [Rhodococcus sp. 1168]ORI21260.1 hypothetical protein BJI47_17740 [Rhodococcus sp. 1168]
MLHEKVDVLLDRLTDSLLTVPAAGPSQWRVPTFVEAGVQQARSITGLCVGNLRVVLVLPIPRRRTAPNE